MKFDITFIEMLLAAGKTQSHKKPLKREDLPLIFLLLFFWRLILRPYKVVVVVPGRKFHPFRAPQSGDKRGSQSLVPGF